jgi:S-adenosylmethionine hydrolase
MSYDWISFTTDYGIDDGFVAACEGVIARIAPAPRVLHVSHTVPPQDVRRGGAILAQAVPYLPAAVHLAVVDPGVGTDRRGVVLVAAEGLLVGPDNGLLVPAAEACGGVTEVHELTNAEYALPSVSRTFHGRDLFAPAAAHLALGVELAELGPPVDPETLVRLNVPTPDVGEHRIRSTVLYVDSFGNIQLNLTRDDLDRGGIEPGRMVELVLGAERFYATAARTFGDARTGDLILYEDSYRNISIAINRGSASELLGAYPGQELRINLDV